MYVENTLSLLHSAEKLKKSRGLYTEDQVQRCVQLGGQFGRAVDNLFSKRVGSENCFLQRTNRQVKCSDVQAFCQRHNDKRLWDCVPGRVHNGFEKVRHEWRVKDPVKFARKLCELSHKLDLWRKFM